MDLMCVDLLVVTPISTITADSKVEVNNRVTNKFKMRVTVYSKHETLPPPNNKIDNIQESAKCMAKLHLLYCLPTKITILSDLFN